MPDGKDETPAIKLVHGSKHLWIISLQAMQSQLGKHHSTVRKDPILQDFCKLCKTELIMRPFAQEVGLYFNSVVQKET